MELLEILISLVLVVVLLLAITGAISFDRSMLRRLQAEFRDRARTALPYLIILGVVLLFNAQFRSIVHNISWAIGFNITPHIVRIEGQTIVVIQDFFGEGFALFFTIIYVYGYVFLLVFPLIAYFLLDRMNMFKSMTIAYTANYGIGLLCYVVFIAFGPRNAISVEVEQFLLPQYQLLTTQVNEYTNVFPSLHTSLSATVMIYAWKSRQQFTAWLLISWFIGLSVIISTMYLGIHWVIDVIAGIVLAIVAYLIGEKAVKDNWIQRVAIMERITSLRATFRL